MTTPARDRQFLSLKQETARRDLWDDPPHAVRVTQQLDELTRQTAAWARLQDNVRHLEELAQLAIDEADDPLIEEIAAETSNLERETLDHLQSLALDGPHDHLPAIITLQAGAGGTEAQLWTEILLGMYTAWSNRNGHPSILMHTAHGDRGGLRNATLEVSAPQAYGRLRAEAGVHRLMRPSPTDTAGRRQTSFARVEALPAPPPQDEQDLFDPSDIRFDAFRASGHGGQHIHKVSTAVRLVHIPTGVTVTCQTERSQSQNRTYATRLLAAKLRKIREDQEQEEFRQLRGNPPPPTWGRRTRSYSLQPSQHIVDHRTGHRTTQALATVQESLIDAFINAALLARAQAG